MATTLERGETYRQAIEAIQSRYNPEIERLEREAQELIDAHCADGGHIPHWPNKETYARYQAVDAAWKAAIEARNKETDAVNF